MRPFITIALLLVCSALMAQPAETAQRGVTVHKDAAFDGYTLYCPLGTSMTLLVDMEGNVVKRWDSQHQPANGAYLLENGDLLRAAKFMDNKIFGNRGPSGGRVQRFNWDGELLWDYVFSSDQYHHHHDIEPLPNGNVLILAWERILPQDAIAAGRKPDGVPDQGLFPEIVVEVKQTGFNTGEIVWQWRVWDHLIQDADATKANFGPVEEHPELIDVNIRPARRADWMHTNSIAYNPELDQIILSVRAFNELLVIDHSTTTQQAAGHEGGRAGRGGDILYRWGNPANYRAGNADDRKLFLQHDARWVRAGRPGEGNITLFNNGQGRPDGDWSSVDEIIPPINEDGSYRITPGKAYEPEEAVWSYSAPNKPDFYSSFISGAERLPNGNTLVCSGAGGIFFEVTADKQIVWEMLNPVISQSGGGPRGRGGPHSVFRVTRYPTDYPGVRLKKPD